MNRKLYSYQRWSSAVQKDGTTKDRQETAARAYAEHNGFDYVEIVDDGVSAFAGKNSKSGALGQFLDAVDNGFIAGNSLLYVESLDRLSRDQINNALMLFMGILGKGIEIYTGFDNKLYNEESLKNPFDLMQSILTFSRGHDESATKQKRTIESARALITAHQRGEPVTIKGVGSHPWWIDGKTPKDEKVKPEPVLFAIAQKIMELLLEGMSINRIVQYLNDTYPLACNGKTWAVPNIRKMKTNKAVYGLRELTVDGVNYKLIDYFPPLITEVQFLRMQRIQERNKYKGFVREDGKKNNINLLSGLGIFRCLHCGSTMVAWRGEKDDIRYKCEAGDKNGKCKIWSLPGELVEHALMEVVTIAYIRLTNKGDVEKEDYSVQVQDIKKAIEEVQTGIVNLTKMVERGIGKLESTYERIESLETQRENLIIELEVAERKAKLADDNSFEKLMFEFFNYAQWGVMQTVDHEYRHKLREIVQACVEDVRASKVDRKLTLSFTVKGLGEKITYTTGDKRYDYKVLRESVDVPKLANKGEVVQERIEQYENALDAGFSELLTTARGMLETVHYPAIDGRMFWPRK